MRTLTTEKRILITGASRGIGRAAALALSRRGHEVVLSARSEDDLRAVAAEIEGAGGRASVVPMDVTDDRSVEAALARVRESCDILVNNAGACRQIDFLLQTDADRRAEMELNYWGALRVTRAVLPAMMARGSGVVVNVSSLLATVAAPTTASYSASKAALEAWSHALRGEVARFGVDIVVFVAPHTDTEAGRRVRFDGVRSLPVDYVAEELVRAIDRAPRRYAASPVYRALLRVAGVLPGFVEARVAASARPYLAPMSRLLAPCATASAP